MNDREFARRLRRGASEVLAMRPDVRCEVVSIVAREVEQRGWPIDVSMCKLIALMQEIRFNGRTQERLRQLSQMDHGQCIDTRVAAVEIERLADWIEMYSGDAATSGDEPATGVNSTGDRSNGVESKSNPAEAAGNDVATGDPNVMTVDQLPKNERLAFLATQHAEQQAGVETVSDAWDWLDENGFDGYKLPLKGSFASAVSRARNKLGELVNNKRAGRVSRSIVKRPEA